MSQRTLDNQSDGAHTPDEVDVENENQDNQNDTHLPPISQRYGASPHNSPASHKKMTVHERLYDPDFRKNRGVPTEPEPIYVREFKSRPPKQLEHVKSRHMDAAYFEPRAEHVPEPEEESTSQFKSKPPKNLEHVTSRHMSQEYLKKRQSMEDAHEDRINAQFVSRPPKNLGHVQSKILDPKYLQEKPQAEEETYDTEFRARLPKKLEHVQSKIMDPKYLQEKPAPEEERYDNEFKARLPKKLEHVQSRIHDPKKPKASPEEPETVSLSIFKARPPKHLEQVGSRINDPAYFEPRPEHVYETEEDNIDHNFKARLPKSLQHVESRALDPKYLKRKVPPIPTEDRDAQYENHNFKARLPKSLAHVQSRAFDPNYNKNLSPRYEIPVVELKQKGQIVVINVKKDPERRSRSEGYRGKLDKARGKDGKYYNQWKDEFNDMEQNIVKHTSRKDEEMPQPQDKKERKRWKPPKKPKPETINKDYFDSWVMTPNRVYNKNDMLYRNGQRVSGMWNGFDRTINGGHMRPIERTYY